VTYKYLGFGDKTELEKIEAEAEKKLREEHNMDLANKYAAKKR